MGDIMPYPSEKLRVYPDTYIVQDRSQEEMARLAIQDKMITTGMGGVLPELADPTPLQQVLDVGCGTGGWLIETARTYPAIERLVGVDISLTAVECARAEAKDQHPDRRVQFQVMDALRRLDFPPESVDLINQRLGISWLRTWEWKKLLREYQRLARPGGIIRITEGNIITESNSAALMKLFDLLLEAFHRSGRLFTQGSDGVRGELVRVMTQCGIQDVKYQVHPCVFQAGTVQGQYFYQNIFRLFRVILPFFRKWIHVPGDYDEVYQQALKEVQHPEFVARSVLLTAWGTRNDKALSPRT